MLDRIFLYLLVLTGLSSCNKATVSYLGQQPPGMSPEIFAPSIVNTDSIELNAVFNKSFTEFFFTRMVKGSFLIHHSELQDGEWTSPKVIHLFPDEKVISTAVDMTLTLDGKTMYFLGRKDPEASVDIFVSKKVDGQWQTASRVPEPISTEAYSEFYPVVVADGSLYFVSNRPEGVGQSDIYRAQYLGEGKFDKPVSIGPLVNSEWGSGDTYVAPDESYLITNTRRPDPGIYVSFKEDDQWQEPIYLDKPINSEWTDFCPYMSPDGAYFFFSRRYSDPPDSGWQGVFKGEVYWMDAKSILELREK